MLNGFPFQLDDITLHTSTSIVRPINYRPDKKKKKDVSPLLSYLRWYVIFFRSVCDLFNSQSSYAGTVFGLKTFASEKLEILRKMFYYPKCDKIGLAPSAPHCYTCLVYSENGDCSVCQHVSLASSHNRTKHESWNLRLRESKHEKWWHT